jgi:phosphatidylglycerol lysyltransferase
VSTSITDLPTPVPDATADSACVATTTAGGRSHPRWARSGDVRWVQSSLSGKAARAAWAAPFTASVIAVMLAMGVATRTLWQAVDVEDPLLQSLSYGAPQLGHHWWTFAVGAMVLPRPEFYLLVGLLLAVGLSWYERRVGARWAAVVFIGTQLGATLATALALPPLRGSGWSWAAGAGTQVDLGLSAGAMGVLGAATALMSPPGARRIRLAVLTYLSVLVLKSGLLWDVEHLLAFCLGLAAGPRIAGRRAGFVLPHVRAVDIRSGVAMVIAAVAVANLVESAYPGVGGIFGTGRPTHPPMHHFPVVVLELVVALLVADALRRGRSAAWWVACCGTLAIGVNTVLNARGAARATDVVCCVVVLTLLVCYRNAWSWRTPEGFARKCLRRVGRALATSAIGSVFLVWCLRNSLTPHAGPGELLQQAMSRLTFTTGPLRPTDMTARLMLNLSAALWAVVLICLLVPFLRADRGPDRGPREALGQLLRRHGGGSIGWMRTWPAFSTWTSADGQVAISYCVVGTVAIAIGDPVGAESSFRAASSGFRRFCHHAGWTPCWFAATSALRNSAPGWRSTQIGEDTVMDLRDLNFVGKSWQDVRTARNRATREGITMVGGRLADLSPALHEQIDAISREWVQRKPIPEMGFTLGTLQHAMDPEMRTHLAIGADGKVQGVTTWLPIHREGQVVGWTLDLMRRRPDGFRPVMEYLIAESALLFQQQGFEVMSLSVAPLARRTRPLGRRTMLDRTLDAMSAVLEPTYGFTSLLAFKAKFHPQFRPVYLLYSSPSDLLGISLAIGRAYLPQVKPRELVGLLRALSTRAAD